jgi:type I restriction enzyme S subunit
LYWDGDIPWITTSQINFGEITEAEQFITQQGLQFSSAKMIDKGALLIAMYGQGKTRGKVGVLQINATINQACAAVRLNDKVVHRFVYHYLVNQYEYIRALSNSGGQENLSGFIVKLIPIVLPPTKEEQTAIATALSDMDALLDGLDRLITKKRNLKQAAMQQLLTGKTRLAGFEGEWSKVKIGQKIDLLTGFPFPSSKYSETGIRLLRGSNIKRGNTDWTNDIVQYWPEMTTDLKNFALKEKDIVIAMDGSLVGRSFAQISEADLPALLLQRVARIRSTQVDINYLKEWVCSEFFTIHCDAVKTVTAIPHISPHDIKSFQIYLPPTKDEQAAIAAVLADMDAEIAALEQRRTKTRDIKQGMMQELLTGRTRLV